MITVHELVEEIRQAMRDFDELRKEYEGRVEEYAKAKAAYKYARHGAYIKAEGTQELRKAQAEVFARELEQDMITKEGLCTSALEATRTARTKITAWQSILSTTKEEIKLAGTGPEAI